MDGNNSEGGMNFDFSLFAFSIYYNKRRKLEPSFIHFFAIGKTVDVDRIEGRALFAIGYEPYSGRITVNLFFYEFSIGGQK